jgi:hypothetical protein
MLIRSEADLRAARRVWRAFHVLAVLVEQKVFDALADGEVHAVEELGRWLELDGRALRICLDLMAASGLVIREGAAYRQSGAAPGVVAAVRELLHEVHQLPQLLKGLQSGMPLVPTSGGILADHDDRNFEFLTGLHRRSREQVPEAVRAVRRALQLDPALGRRPRLLDLGGGHGCFAAAFAEQLPGAEVTLFDREPVVAIARRLSGTRFAVRAGDFFHDGLGGPYDLVFISNVLHAESVEMCGQLLRRVREALTRAGAVVVRDRFLDESGAGPDYAADFGVTLLFTTHAGQPRTLQETVGLLRQAGFTTIAHHQVPAEEYGYIIGSCAPPDGGVQSW